MRDAARRRTKNGVPGSACHAKFQTLLQILGYQQRASQFLTSHRAINNVRRGRAYRPDQPDHLDLHEARAQMRHRAIYSSAWASAIQQAIRWIRAKRRALVSFPNPA